MTEREKQSVEQWEAELKQRGLLRIVREACRKHGITLKEFFEEPRRRSVTCCRCEVVQQLLHAEKSQADIRRWLGLTRAAVAYYVTLCRPRPGVDA